ncbi:unnamed protein product [Oikopleura dioica]|uniref:Uncharacterized protein n=1 Tax=Oikopleura dioica TaxID=34765 RepID=E4YBH5_OIKDI|nr:unnamed protein product [Oikopleura dioica]
MILYLPVLITVSSFIISLSVGFLTSSENHCARWKNAAQRIQARVDPALEAQTQARGIAQAGAAIPVPTSLTTRNRRIRRLLTPTLFPAVPVHFSISFACASYTLKLC